MFGRKCDRLKCEFSFRIKRCSGLPDSLFNGAVSGGGGGCKGRDCPRWGIAASSGLCAPTTGCSRHKRDGERKSVQPTRTIPMGGSWQCRARWPRHVRVRGGSAVHCIALHASAWRRTEPCALSDRLCSGVHVRSPGRARRMVALLTCPCGRLLFISFCFCAEHRGPHTRLTPPLALST